MRHMMHRLREARKNGESGFTLIELLIVIVILGVLAAVVVFAVSAFNKNGQQAACKADFKNVEIADEAYFAKQAQAGAGGTYATTYGTVAAPGQLVPNYLKEAPDQTGRNGYSINLGANGPLVAIPPAPTGGVADVNTCNSLS